MPGIGQKSLRTQARELHKNFRWRPERIAAALGIEDVNQVAEWIYGKARRANKRRVSISEASPEQRSKVKGRACVVCRSRAGECHPAHLIDRSLCSVGADDELAVIPLCPDHHRAYDEDDLDLLPHLEPAYRPELAFAVERVGLLTALFRITNAKWEASAA